MKLSQIEARMFDLADAARNAEQEAIADAIVALIPSFRACMDADRTDFYRRHQDLMTKWNEFMNGSIVEEQARQKELEQRAIAAMVRKVATNSNWRGTYTELAKLAELD